MASVSAECLTVYGEINSVLFSTITQEKIFKIDQNLTGFSFGFGASGENASETITKMGELLTLPGKSFFLPARKPEKAGFSFEPKHRLHTPFNVNLGNIGNIQWNQPENSRNMQKSGEFIESWIQNIDQAGVYPLYGFVYLAKIERLEGAWVKKAPFKTTKPVNGKQISAPSNVKDYFEFVSEIPETPLWAVIVGVALDTESKGIQALGGKETLVFYRNPGDKGGGGRYKIHEHAVIFVNENETMPSTINELTEKVTGSNFLDVKHLLDNALISNAKGILKAYTDINSIQEP